MSAEALLEEARKLGVADRSHLVEELWNSVDSQQVGLPITAEQREELDRRLAGLAANRERGLPVG